jgi:uroporphyrinogen decarboxylase
MRTLVTRRVFLNSATAVTASFATGKNVFAARNKREVLLGLLDKSARWDYIPAAFFIHFGKDYHFGQAAAEKHLEYFRFTNMDFVKIQYELEFPGRPEIEKPEDWGKMPLYKLDFYQPQLEAVKGLVQAAKREALVLMTLYSPFMLAGQTAGSQRIVDHIQENPDQAKKGMEIITESLMLFVSECIRLGVDGFYTSTQGGEEGRFKNPRLFQECIKPFDLILMKEINRRCAFNILHICDYNAPYADLSPFLDYPGHVVNCNPRLVSRELTCKEIAQLFARPFMGGLDRKGIVATGTTAEVGRAVEQVLRGASDRFILGADCTLPGDVSWENIKTAIATAHAARSV